MITQPARSLVEDTDGAIRILDQRLLPFSLVWVRVDSAAVAAQAIREMWCRGAPLLAAVGAYGLTLALEKDPENSSLHRAHQTLLETRPTAVNLRWALDRVRDGVVHLPPEQRAAAARAICQDICEEDVVMNHAIGRYGLALLIEIAARKKPGDAVTILTHCNAGRLATIAWGTALAPIYLAHAQGVKVHVWVDETRPRNQGASLTAWELADAGIPHTLICDNAGGLLMQQGKVDICLVGVDRVAANGDACNKIGTYLKALAARDNDVPFYVALPSPTFDASLAHGGLIPIEERSADEVTTLHGLDAEGKPASVRVVGTPATAISNPGFDVTPARLVTGYVTDKGVLKAGELNERIGF
ncbi:MAG: S-methyl-5-thioribose-1-phosphate isomerase [Holosporales bacterium]|jgi:methylthioribose-1-phosphate isomerase